MNVEDTKLDDLKEWVQPLHPNIPINVREVEISCIPPPDRKDRKLSALYKECFSGRESKHHSFLKWFALNWSYRRKSDLRMASWCGSPLEVPLVLPGYFDEKTKYGRRIRGNFGRELIVWPSDKLLVPDIYCHGKDLCIECGQTTPLSLIAPLYTFAVKATIWVPYPHDEIDTDWPSFDETVSGYKFTRQQPQNLKTKS